MYVMSNVVDFNIFSFTKFKAAPVSEGFPALLSTKWAKRRNPVTGHHQKFAKMFDVKRWLDLERTSTSPISQRQQIRHHV